MVLRYSSYSSKWRQLNANVSSFFLAFSFDFNVYWLDFFIAFRQGDRFNNLHHSLEKVHFFFFGIFISSFYQSLISQCNTGLQAVTTVRSTTGGLQTHHLLRLSNYLAFYCWMCCCWLAQGESNICFLPKKFVGGQWKTARFQEERAQSLSALSPLPR